MSGTESSVTLNPGAGGAAVRTEQVTPPGATVAVQQQVVTLADPNVGTAADVDMSGALQTRSAETAGLLSRILEELSAIRLTLEHIGGCSVLDQVQEDE